MAVYRASETGCRNHWREPKRCRSFSLTDTAWGLLLRMAEFNQCSASEVVERWVRAAAKAAGEGGIEPAVQPVLSDEA